MRNTLRSFALALAVSALAGAATAAPSPAPRPVETESIVVPPDEAPANGVDDEAPADADEPAPTPAPPMEVPLVEYDFSQLPTPVRRLREQIIAAATTGDPEALRPIIDANGEPPQLGSAEVDDPIAYLKSQSGDAEGREILAIIIEVFDAGYVHVDVGTPDEMYVWPYFARYPVDALTPPQLVELFKLVYAGDYEDMLAYGLYTSYRAGIAPDGTWRYFLAD